MGKTNEIAVNKLKFDPVLGLGFLILLITTSSWVLCVSEPENQQLHFLEKINQRTAGSITKTSNNWEVIKAVIWVFQKNRGTMAIYVYINWFFDFSEDHG